MAIEEKWYDGKYYNATKLINTEESTPEQYWGIAGSSLNIKRSPPSLLDAMSEKIFPGSISRFRLLNQTSSVDAFEEEMVARIAASTLLTKKQLIDYMKLCGLLAPISDSLIESWIIERRLKKLLDLQLLEQVTLTYSSGKSDHKAFRITELGQQMARKKGVRIHKGNMYQSPEKRAKTGLLDTPTQIMRMLVANNIALQFLNDSNNIEHFEFMTTLHMKGEITLHTITRSALSVIKEDGSTVLYEVFRRPDPLHQTTEDLRNYDKYIKDKIRRYFELVQRADFLEKNSLSLKAIPKLAIVAEDPSHLDELEKLLTPFIKRHRVDERADVIFICDYGLDSGIIYNPKYPKIE